MLVGDGGCMDLLSQGGAEVTWKIISSITVVQENRPGTSEEYLPGSQEIGEHGVTLRRAWGRLSGNTA